MMRLDPTIRVDEIPEDILVKWAAQYGWAKYKEKERSLDRIREVLEKVSAVAPIVPLYQQDSRTKEWTIHLDHRFYQEVQRTLEAMDYEDALKVSHRPVTLTLEVMVPKGVPAKRVLKVIKDVVAQADMDQISFDRTADKHLYSRVVVALKKGEKDA